jgi:HlyD family secretion protein
MAGSLKDDLEALRIEPGDATPSRKRWAWVTAATFGGLLVALAVFAAARRLGAVEVNTVRAMRTEATRPGGGEPLLTASGYLVARREAVVSAKIQGRLSELRVEEGDDVREGEVIARLESADYVAQLERARSQIKQVAAQRARADAAIARAEADLAEFRRQLAVSGRLAKEEIVARDNFEAAQSRVRIAEAAAAQARAELAQVDADRARVAAELGFAEAQLANTVIRAPFPGTVVRKMAEVGESVAPIPPGVNISIASGAIVALADLATLEMEADVSESNVARLTEEQPAEVTVEAFPDKRYKAILRQVIPTADRTKATVQVKVTLIEKDATLKPEMSAKVTFLGSATEPAGVGPPTPQIVVPQAAIVQRGGTAQVFEVVGDVIRSRKVAVARTRGSDVLVSQGLSGGETLVVSPSDSLREGARVRVTQQR